MTYAVLLSKWRNTVKKFLCFCVVAFICVVAQPSFADSFQQAIKAVEKGDAKSLQLLIKKGFDINEANDYGDDTLLSYVVEFSEHKKRDLEFLFKHGAKVDVKTGDGQTALMRAAFDGDLESITCLLKHKADVKALDEVANTAAHFAAQGGQKAALQLLVKNKANLKAQNQHGETVLMAAITGSEANTKTAKFIIDTIKNAEGKNLDNTTALMQAASLGKKDFITLLLKNKADINAQNSWGATALHFALSDGLNEDIYGTVELLLKNGAKVQLKNKEGKRALDLAKSLRNKEVRKRVLHLLQNS